MASTVWHWRAAYRTTCARSLQRLSLTGFVLLFPGFGYYHVAVAAGVVPPFVGGLFGVASIALGGLFFAGGFLCPSRFLEKLDSYSLFVAVFFLYCFAWIALNWTFGGGATEMEQAVVQAVEALAPMVVLFLIGMYFINLSAWVVYFFLLLFGLAVIGLLSYVVLTGDSMFYARVDLGGGENVASYQGFGRSMALTALVVFALVRRVSAKIVILTAGLVSLYILGSRSEFVGFALATGGLLVLAYLRRPMIQIGVLLGLALALWTFFSFVGVVGENRILELLNLRSSNSWNLRLHYQAVALEQITKHWILGEFGGHLFENGDRGTYAHNALSAWVSYGIVGFLLYIGLTVFAVFWSARRFIDTRGMAVSWSLSFVVNLFSLILIVGSKSVFWTVPAFGWGVLIAARIQERQVARGTLGAY